MSKHNNNLGNSSKGRCKCGRFMTLGEDHAGVSGYNYECPDCFHRRNSKPLTREEYYATWECSLFKKT